MKPLKLLILGGSGEAAGLARALHGVAHYDVILSLAGRTAGPAPIPGKVRSGGFGGAEGLARMLADEGFDLVIDATHPFAVQMKANAIQAARAACVHLLAIRRPPWVQQKGDDWSMVQSIAERA
jgi:precorrin-6A/cobalt-precorrin-6A reductase